MVKLLHHESLRHTHQQLTGHLVNNLPESEYWNGQI